MGGAHSEHANKFSHLNITVEKSANSYELEVLEHNAPGNPERNYDLPAGCTSGSPPEPAIGNHTCFYPIARDIDDDQRQGLGEFLLGGMSLPSTRFIKDLRKEIKNEPDKKKASKKEKDALCGFTSIVDQEKLNGVFKALNKLKGYKTCISIEKRLAFATVKACKEANIVWRSAYLYDFHAPSTYQLNEFCTFVRDRLRQGNVIMHCIAGHGRTGLFQAAYVLFANDGQFGRKFFNASDALLYVRKANPHACEVKIQYNALCRFSDFLGRALSSTMAEMEPKLSGPFRGPKVKGDPGHAGEPGKQMRPEDFYKNSEKEGAVHGIILASNYLTCSSKEKSVGKPRRLPGDVYLISPYPNCPTQRIVKEHDAGAHEESEFEAKIGDEDPEEAKKHHSKKEDDAGHDHSEVSGSLLPDISNEDGAGVMVVLSKLLSELDLPEE